MFIGFHVPLSAVVLIFSLFGIFCYAMGVKRTNRVWREKIHYEPEKTAEEVRKYLKNEDIRKI